MIVLIFVTQNNFKTVQEFPTVSLDFTTSRTSDLTRVNIANGFSVGHSTNWAVPAPMFTLFYNLRIYVVLSARSRRSGVHSDLSLAWDISGNPKSAARADRFLPTRGVKKEESFGRGHRKPWKHWLFQGSIDAQLLRRPHLNSTQITETRNSSEAVRDEADDNCYVMTTLLTRPHKIRSVFLLYYVGGGGGGATKLYDCDWIKHVEAVNVFF